MQKWQSTFLSITALLLITFFFQNCGIVETPHQPGQSALSSLSIHAEPTIAAMECRQCHEQDRKDLAHYAGQDCRGCHTPTVWSAAQGMPHAANGSTSSSLLNCTECHGLTGSALTRLTVPDADHYFQATNCVGCHSDFSSFTEKLSFNHASQVQSGYCFECHNFDSGSYTSFTRVAPFNTTNSFTILDSVGVSARVGSDPNGVFSSPQMHSGSNMRQCALCHVYTAPTSPTVNVWQFVHRASNPGLPRLDETQASQNASCTVCHRH